MRINFEIVSIFLIAISLSLDAFSLSIAYGILGISQENMLYCSIIVGIFHFIMPLVGITIGTELVKYLKIDTRYLICAIFFILIFQIIKSLKEEIKYNNLNILNIILFGFFVSIDSFSVGIGLNVITNKILLSCIVFSAFSFIFTITGFKLGKIVSNKTGEISKIIAAFILTILLLYYLIS